MKSRSDTMWHSCAILTAIVAVSAAAVFGGCSQSTKTPLDQKSAQQSQTNADSADDAATQGSNVNINVINAPGNSRMPNPGADGADTNGGFPGLLDQLASGENTTNLAKSNAGYAQAGINITVSTGSTTPTLGGATSGAATGTQTASGTQTATPTQTTSPQFTTAVPVAVALPGGFSDSGASAGGSGGTASLEKQSSAEFRQAFLDAAARDPSLIADLLDAALGVVDSGSNGL